MRHFCILDGKEPVPEPDLIKWAAWFQTADRSLARTQSGDVTISTVFLGLDYNFTFDSPPVLFETMVFGGELDGETRRYSTWDKAIAGHGEMEICVEEVIE